MAFQTNNETTHASKITQMCDCLQDKRPMYYFFLGLFGPNEIKAVHSLKICTTVKRVDILLINEIIYHQGKFEASLNASESGILLLSKLFF